MKLSLSAVFAVAALCLLSACAGSHSPAGSAAAGGSNVEVFGVIDAGVSHTTTRSGR